MKKLLGKILLIVMAIAMVFTFVACDSVDFTATKYKSWGEVKENNGFLAQTENYVYFINGVGSYTGDNTYGAPLKGSLMVAPLSDLDSAEVAVPKLFVSTDYNSGLFIAGSGKNTFVYYGTPNLDKNSSGDIANYEMMFMKTRLDGSDSEEFFSVSSHSTEYRFVESSAGVVYLVYYDTDNTALVCYNTATGSSKTIVETDDELDQSLSEYKFALADSDSDFVVYYTKTIYAEPYNSKVESRLTESYNKLYAFDVNQGEVLLCDGEADGSKYSFTAVNQSCLFYKKTLANSKEENYAYSFSNNESTKIVNESYATTTTLFVSLSEAYVVEDSNIFRISFAQDKKSMVAVVSASSLVMVDGDYIYYVNSSSKIARIKMEDEEANEEIVSESSVSVTWYNSEVISNGEDKLLCYTDGSYIYYTKINVEAKEKTEDDVTTYYLDGEKLLGRKTNADQVSYVESLISSISITYDADEKTVASESLVKAQTAYSNLSASLKSNVSSSATKKLTNYAKALELSEKLVKLQGIENYEMMEQANQVEMENAYLEAKAYTKSLSNLETIKGLCNNNLKWYFQTAQEVFED